MGETGGARVWVWQWAARSPKGTLISDCGGRRGLDAQLRVLPGVGSSALYSLRSSPATACCYGLPLLLAATAAAGASACWIALLLQHVLSSYTGGASAGRVLVQSGCGDAIWLPAVGSPVGIPCPRVSTTAPRRRACLLSLCAFGSRLHQTAVRWQWLAQVGWVEAGRGQVGAASRCDGSGGAEGQQIGCAVCVATAVIACLVGCVYLPSCQ